MRSYTHPTHSRRIHPPDRIQPHTYAHDCLCPECCWREKQLRAQLQAAEETPFQSRYAAPNPAFNSRREGLLVNQAPECGDPSKPHDWDPTCLCGVCRMGENRGEWQKWELKP